MATLQIGASAGGSRTDEGEPGAAAISLPSGRFSGRSQFAQIVRDALAGAVREGWREIVISDASFEDWPLGELAVVESLRAWSRTGRRLTVLAANYDELYRRHARFVTWRRKWTHIIECRRCAAADPVQLPSAVWSPAWALRRLDLERSTGICGSDPLRGSQVREILTEWLRQSTPGFPASTLGL